MGAPCHPEQFCEALELEDEKRQCMMRGKRAPEICCGALEALIQEAMDLRFAELLVVVHTYVAQVQAICIAEFNTGRRVLLAELRLRIQTYYMPPV